MKQCARWAGIAAVLAAVILAVGGCNNNTTTTTPNATLVTNTFTGTLTQNGASIFTFTIAGAGSVKVTITALDPNQIVGFLVGNYNPTAGTCASVLSNDVAAQGSVLNASASIATTGCVRIYDAAGTVTTSSTFTLTVEHP